MTTLDSTHSVEAQAAATGALSSVLSAAERSYPTSEVRGRSREDPMPEGWQPRGITPRLRSGAADKSARLRRRRTDREETPRVRGQGWRPGGDTPHPRSGAARRSHLAPEARGAGREEQPEGQPEEWWWHGCRRA